MKFRFFFLLATLSLSAVAQTGARLTSMAHSAVALQDVWSIKHNQAGLCGIEKPIFALGATPNFGDELYTQSFAAILPYRDMVFGLGIQRYGITEYNENTVGFTFARRFENIFIALHSNYHQLYIRNYSLIQNFSVEAGIQYRINQNWLLGFHIANLGGYMHSNAMPVRTQIGTSYLFSENLLLAVTIDKTTQATNIRTGLEYNLNEWISLRGGLSTYPLKQFIGAGIRYNQFKLDIATDSHPVLGYTPQLAISYEL